ncbi:MAG: zinc ribbon domain-containing protein [Thermoplasmata archaeon]
MTRLDETDPMPLERCGRPLVLGTEAEEILICTICLGRIKQGLAFTECDCGKVFHVSCAIRLDSCPSCGARIEDRMRVPGVRSTEEPKIDMENIPIPKLRLTSEEKLELLEERLLLGEISEETFRDLRKKLEADLEVARFQCPCCGRFVAEEDETCKCGVIFSDDEMGNALVCPECSSIIPRDAVFCESCGVRFSDDGIFVCPVCRRELDLDSRSCECGARFSDEVILGFYCPQCGEFQRQENDSCSSCGVGFVEENEVLYQCAGCGETFRENVSVCPSCGAEFSEGS